MSLDTRGRSAAHELLRSTRSDLEGRTMLDTLHRTSDRRTGARIAVAVALVAVLVGVVALSWSAWHPGGSTPPAVTTPTPSATAPTPTSLGLSEPATAVVPAGWTLVSSPGLAELTSLDHYAVSVLLDPVPLATAKHPVPSPLTAESLATWVATHPDLVPASAVATTIGGLPAWQVDVRQSAGAPQGKVCSGNNLNCVPLFRAPTGDYPAGIGRGTVARLYAVTLPSGRLAVVAAGAGGDDRIGALVNATQPLLDSLRFGSG